ncbi:toxic anion resistance protein [Campylobacter sp. W0049]|uniref:toxic anion resistance protein n=1 Tax=Campylobacter molothri TaxID=1032242 RepID=UPI00301E018C|nr:toxic anion resistance protein [Campylobacter sp. W0049]
MSIEFLSDKVKNLIEKKNENISSQNATSLIKITSEQLKNTENVEIYKKIDELQNLINKVSPYNNKAVFNKGGAFSKILSKILKIDHLSNYVEKFESTSKLIDNIVIYLNKSEEELINDNKALNLEINELSQRRDNYLASTKELETLEKECEEYLINEKDEFLIKKFKSETHFPLLQKKIDIKQKIMVIEQSILAFMTIIANNRELIVSLDRTKEVTIEALGVGILMAQSLSEQKRILNSVNGLNKTTSELIQETSNQLKTQATEIQIQASSAMLDMKGLEKSFNNCLESFEKIRNFREKATDEIKQQINEFDNLMNNLNSKLLLLEK